MKILSIAALLLMLTNCAGGNVAKIKLGKKCTVADSKQIQESSFIWFVSKEALEEFDERTGRSHWEIIRQHLEMAEHNRLHKKYDTFRVLNN